MNKKSNQGKKVSKPKDTFSHADSVTAAIMGVCVGDAVGLPVQFESRKARKQKPVTEMIGYGVFKLPPGSWSDDSSLTLCLVDALVKVHPHERKRFLTQVAKNFCLWYEEGYLTPHGKAYDIGGTTQQAVEKLLKGVSPKKSGRIDEYSNGNGSLMRILPLAFYYQLFSFAELIQLTHEVSAITHGHIRSQIACGIYISIAVSLLKENSPREAYLQGVNTITAIYAKPPYISEMFHYKRVIDGDLYNLTEAEINSSGYVVDALEASLWCWLNSESYPDAVLKAVNLGGDTDTIAAIAGGLAGIQYGLDGIPSHWIKQLFKLEDILRLTSFLQQSLLNEY